MGQKNQKPKKVFEIGKDSRKEQSLPKEEKITKSSFKFMSIIGRGGFGKVWKVYSKKYKTIYAMKEMSKTKIIDKRSEKSVKAERDLLENMHHPFIINMHFSFQDNDHLYITMDLLTGGDLRYHLCRKKKFSEPETKFFIACIILSLEYIHTNNIIHRDLKPENLVMDNKGYVKLTDFGIAKEYVKENKTETSGTPGYMAPEVMCSQNHTIAVDYFALGVIGYEFMNGKRPYVGKNRKEIKAKILSTQVQVKKGMVPQGWSFESADFINRLIQRKPANRLGLRGPTEVKEHLWFKDYDWKNLYCGKLISPFQPKDGDNFDYNYCNEPDRIGANTQERYYNIMSSQRYKEVFLNFYYFNRLSAKSGRERDNLKKFKNPHLIYLKIDKEEEELKNHEIKAPIIINNNIININNYNFSAIDNNINLQNHNSNNINDINNDSYVKRDDLFIPINGIAPGRLFKGEEQFSDVRKLSSYKSTNLLLKGYKNRSSSALIRGGKKYNAANYDSMKFTKLNNNYEDF